ncbi:MAG: FAD-dependent oxidoreductase [Siphonobacter aquaeclarae]|nr:FAD-dependent oxidoreductase [Siphonobacter aquaeclarae]
MSETGIIGGGISGLCAAWYLVGEGRQVTIFNDGPIADGCSFGNAGMIVPSHIIPLAQPGMIAKGLRWMFDSTSPFYIKPRLNAALLRWGWQFYRHANEEHVAHSIPALRDLSLRSKELYRQLAKDLGFTWTENGLFMLYKTESAEKEMRHEADVANGAGIEAKVLSATEVQTLEPNVRVNVRGAVYFPGDAHVTPGEVMRALVAGLKQRGVRFEDAAVTGFQRNGSRVTGIEAGGAVFPVDDIIVAAGAWSPELTRLLNYPLLLQGGKGYSFEWATGAPDLRVPAILLEARATATPMAGGIRFAGTMEIAGTDLTVNPNRVRGIHQALRQYYPDFDVPAPPTKQVWSGLRPCSPDGLPYIGGLPEWENVVLATGHGMMGLSLGPATGELVAQLLTSGLQAVDPAPFRPDRF